MTPEANMVSAMSHFTRLTADIPFVKAMKMPCDAFLRAGARSNTWASMPRHLSPAHSSRPPSPPPTMATSTCVGSGFAAANRGRDTPIVDGRSTMCSNVVPHACCIFSHVAGVDSSKWPVRPPSILALRTASWMAMKTDVLPRRGGSPTALLLAKPWGWEVFSNRRTRMSVGISPASGGLYSHVPSVRRRPVDSSMTTSSLVWKPMPMTSAPSACPMSIKGFRLLPQS
mmetsp:Transcript_10032/g.28953  ORF Transcript_10032/g.28953 Transcript_10032/m.28953 type:complete len:228 (-) Transcript_10032:2074-2757(-)